MSTERKKVEPAFPFGRIKMTPGAELLAQADVAKCLLRHLEADWGDISNADKRVNDEALLYGSGLLSSYVDRNGKKFMVITEADRSITTVLLPEEY